MDAMDLDIDMDVDLFPDEPINAQAQDSPSPGEVVDHAVAEDQAESKTLVPYKIHIRGLDSLNPEEVKVYVAEHYPGSAFERIEWIDDTSANLIFSSESTAQEALVALASVQIADATQLPLLELLPAKSFSKKPKIGLGIRFAVAADRKQRGAAERSRFYLLNPEYDPENRKKYRDRDSEVYRCRHRRDDTPPEPFDVNLYDDDAGALAMRNADSRPRRRRSLTPPDYDSDRHAMSYRNSNRNKELFSTQPNGRYSSYRDRSASPGRERNGDMNLDDVSSDGSAARNRLRARTIKERLSRSNRSKELFPEKSSFGNDRLDDVAELSSRFSLPMYDGSNDVVPTRGKRLEDRITVPGSGGRLADRITDPSENSGFNIRGAAKQRGTHQGFAIKGASKTVRELFPEKFGSNAGKELFADRLEGRSRRRQKAGDLFD